MPWFATNTSPLAESYVALLGKFPRLMVATTEVAFALWAENKQIIAVANIVSKTISLIPNPVIFQVILYITIVTSHTVSKIYF